MMTSRLRIPFRAKDVNECDVLLLAKDQKVEFVKYTPLNETVFSKVQINTNSDFDFVSAGYYQDLYSEYQKLYDLAAELKLENIAMKKMLYKLTVNLDL